VREPTRSHGTQGGAEADLKSGDDGVRQANKVLEKKKERGNGGRVELQP